MKKIVFLLAIFALAVSMVFAGGDKEGMASDSGMKQYTIATVVKLDGIAWFDRMREGVDKFAQDTGHDAYLIGPAKADAALQVQMIDNLIAQGVDAIAVVPFSPESLEPVLKKAMDAGIVIVVHEATSQQNTHAIIEAFQNKDFGKQMAERLVKSMGGKGEMSSVVGSLTSKSHNEQQDGVEEYIKDFPDIKLVSPRNEDYDDQTRSYEITKELLTAYPNLKGMVGSPSSMPPGAGLAVDERKLQDKVSIVGVTVPSLARDLIKTGAIDTIAFWDPADAGYAMNIIAVKLLNGEEIKNGADLGIKGYNSLKQDAGNPKLFFGEAWVFVDKTNIDQYNF
ncbi:MAG: hypothetical protein B0D92_03280 [Spirochaeta sp. LUC14_002_19_P3]|nr:MAG: hypothetical protein B0D92_03280 [Spirochaeta sp. LUC14_002_19_P3]